MNKLSTYSTSTFQQGVSLLVFAITILTISAAAFFISSDLNPNIATKRHTLQSLAQAKRAMENFFISYIPFNSGIELGRLPFPDRRLDSLYDGISDCINYTAPLTNSFLLGRFPWLRDECNGVSININANLRDGNNDRLWYSVASYMVRHNSNSNFSPAYLDNTVYDQWITLYNHKGELVSDRIAFILISPGTSLSNQNRLNKSPENFLDSYNVPGIGNINNFDDNLTFIKAPEGNSFNDQLIYMTIDELMPKLEKRVLAEFRSLIKKFNSDNAGYPYPARLGDSTFECKASVIPGGGFIATSNLAFDCPSNPMILNLSTRPYLSSWLNFIIYEPRADCINTSVITGCNNQPAGLTVNSMTNIDFILMSTGLHANTGSANRADYLEDPVNQVNDQKYITPDPVFSNDLLIFQ